MNDVLYLPVITVEKDELNQEINKTEYTKLVFCEKESAGRNEFFAAGQNGLKPQYVFIINTLEYNEEASVKYKGQVFNIYRTYERKDETIELYCEVKSGG
ncbi:phage head closure protein [Niallia sp. Man26]|uniref:phage head closure protein n=1 Tax=Niallia sp. Man26 TaxID=2912824 RepID=UPI001EDA0050|nr:phage head closure protein [Niallia sp. Man26]UPO88334.1 phage head closure protein [Niallia sp. Man26]